MDEHCNAIKILTETGFSKTPHRISVLQLLIRTRRLMSAGEIVGEILKNEPTGKGINKVTIYRMLNSFRKAGIIREITTEEGIRHYEMACPHNPVHAHFYCIMCRSMTCLPSSPVSENWRWLNSYQFKIDQVCVHISGVCAQCNATL